MLEPEVQPLVPFILRRSQIMRLFFMSPSVPNPSPRTILEYVITFSEPEEDEVSGDDTEEDLVSAFVVGSVVGPVDVGSYQGAGLDEHVVYRAGDCTGSDRSGVLSWSTRRISSVPFDAPICS
jgi:hypothetical protein